MKRRMMGLVLVAVMAGALVGCASKESKITGAWSATIKEDGQDVSVSIEFFSDKTAQVKVQGEPFPTAKWAILDDGRVKVDGDMTFAFLTKGSSQILFGEIKSGNLILDLGPNGKVPFKR